MVIETGRLILRPVVESDAEDIFAYSREPDVGINAGWQPHADLEETKAVMQEIFLGQEHIFGMELKATGKIIGTVGLLPDPKRQNPDVKMLGYAMSRSCWGRGLMTEAARAVINYGFDSLHLDAVSSCCYPYNKRSSGVMKKCGMVYEGTLKLCELRYDGVVLDNECYIILNNK